jgi:hypothetical protein
MRALVVCIAFVSVLISVWPGESSRAQEGLARRDAQGPVTVVVTLMTPPSLGAPPRAKVVLDTHSEALDSVAFEQAVFMRLANGDEIRSTAVEQVSGSGHHREAVVVFPPLAQAGTVLIVVKGIGGVAERTFLWDAQ